MAQPGTKWVGNVTYAEQSGYSNKYGGFRTVDWQDENHQRGLHTQGKLLNGV